METSNLGMGFAFLAGLASFLSPCVFSLVPAYIGYLGGRSAASARGGAYNRWVTFTHGLAFVFGFSLIFISLGMATSAIGSLLFDLRGILSKIGGILIFVFGLHMTGIMRIPFLEYDLRPQSTPDRGLGYVSSFLMGVFFSAGWSPCVGPILGTILTISLSEGSINQGAILLIAYSAGLAIPFLIASIEIGVVATALRRYAKATRYIEIGMGVLMMIVGVLLFFGRFEGLARFGTFIGTFNELALGRILILLLVILSILGLIPAYIANRKGRNFFDWWFFGAALFPIALIMAIRIKNPSIDERNSKSDVSGDDLPPRSGTGEGIPG